MKFVCDKCKTRYSIGEDRVRGKILKIRCKNCANVITVREGMDAEAPGEGRKRSTTAAPVITPPAALEQEWYVSIDGVQSGPFALAEAQRWIAAKPFEVDLHCWSEGFDDWLPVDKVSHFRNLRKPRAPQRPKTVPPPVPRREEAKPLFAATMAAIEKDVGASPTPPIAARPATAGGRVNGAGSGPVPALQAKGSGSGQVPSIPRIPGPGSGSVPSIPKIPSRAGSGSVPKLPSDSGSVPAIPRTKRPSASHPALAAAFAPDEVTDSRTEAEAPAFTDEAATAADPVAARRQNAKSSNMFDLGSAPAAPEAPEPPPVDPFAAFQPKADAAPPARTVQQALESDDDDLSIGEVSRVVKLADLAPKPRAPTTSGQTGAVARIGGYTASQPKLSPTELGMNVDPSLVPAGPAPDESIVARSFAQRHRRGMVALIAFAALLVAGVIGVVIYITSGQTEEVGRGLGGTTRTIDTSRPEDIVQRQLPPTPGTGSGSATVVTQRPKFTPRNTGPTNTPPPDDDPKGQSLRASEIEDMAAKQGEGTKRCYMRAQKGALGFEIAELKKIAVTLTIGKDGAVSNVDLSSHANDTFGQCLIARIKGWKFRESPNGGTFRISLAFSNG